MPADILLVLQASTTKTATFNGAGVDLLAGTSPAGLVARVIVTAASNATGSNTVTFTVDHSPDNSNWTTLAGARPADTLTLSTTGQTAEVFIPFETRLRFVRLTATLAGAGTVPTFTYQSDIVPAFP